MENCRNAAALLGETGRVLVVTSDYHLRRAVMTARRAGLRADGLAAKTTGGRAGKRLMEACYIADLLLGWQDEGRARPAWTYRLFARMFGEQAKNEARKRSVKKAQKMTANCRLEDGAARVV